MRLEEAVRIALERTQRNGIEGWGLHLGSPELGELGELVRVGPVVGCLDDFCGHVFHDPAAPTLRWVPRLGTLRHLGGDGRHEYYVLRLTGWDLFLRLRPARGYHGGWFHHAELEVIDTAEVPEYLLAQQTNGQ